MRDLQVRPEALPIPLTVPASSGACKPWTVRPQDLPDSGLPTHQTESSACLAPYGGAGHEHPEAMLDVARRDTSSVCEAYVRCLSQAVTDLLITDLCAIPFHVPNAG